MIKETIHNFDQFVNKNYLKSDAIGYRVGKYLYHVTPKRNLSIIKKNGFIPKDGISINGVSFENRLYFATSLIASYDLSVNFGSYRDSEEYIIVKVGSKCVDNGYNKDPLFLHGIYIDYSVNNSYIVDIIEADDLFDKFSDDDIESLYL